LELAADLYQQGSRQSQEVLNLLQGKVKKLRRDAKWNNLDSLTQGLGQLGWMEASDMCSAAWEEVKQESNSLGIFLDYFLTSFQESLHDHLLPDTNFHDILWFANGDNSLTKGCLCPRDRKMNSSLVDALKAEGHSGRATHFLSWVWSYQVSLVDSALREWFGNQANGNQAKLPGKTPSLWWCYFCNNQWRFADAEQDAASLTLKFGSNLRQCREVLCVLDSISDPTYLKRLWCIYEVHTASEERKTITTIIPHHVAQEISELPFYNLEEVFRDAFKVDARNATASRLDDEAVIKRIIENGAGFVQVNSDVGLCIGTAVLKARFQVVPNYGSDSSASTTQEAE